jgi:microcystin-dependent protein
MAMLGEIRMFAGNFAPRGWALCNGALLPISQNDALFALIGTTYGGDGQTTFGLPDLRGRAPLHVGQGQGLSNYTLGQLSGSESVTLLVTQMAAHNHNLQMQCNAAQGSTNLLNPANAFPGSAPGTNTPYAGKADAVMGSGGGGGITGGNQPHENMQPYLVVNFIIAIEGIFPSRN